MMWVCSERGCPTLIPKSGRCQVHARQADRARGTSTQRGYGWTHIQLRAKWAVSVSTGTVECWRCSKLIQPTDEWHLGHDDNDRTVYRGPEHAHCNLSAAGKASHQR